MAGPRSQSAILCNPRDQPTVTLLTTIVSVDPIYAYFDVDEHTVLQVRQMIRQGKVKSARDITWPVFLGLANEDGFSTGTIDFVDNQINPKTGTLRLRGVFPNPREALSPGLFGRLRVPIGFPHKAFLISDRAIDTDQGKKIVYVIDKENKVERAAHPHRIATATGCASWKMVCSQGNASSSPACSRCGRGWRSSRRL